MVHTARAARSLSPDDKKEYPPPHQHGDPGYKISFIKFKCWLLQALTGIPVPSKHNRWSCNREPTQSAKNNKIKIKTFKQILFKNQDPPKKHE